MTDESKYEYKKLLEELKELNEKERERLYRLLRNKKEPVAPSPDATEALNASAGGNAATKGGTTTEINATATNTANTASTNLPPPGIGLRRK
jgi:hypothetical protein